MHSIEMSQLLCRVFPSLEIFFFGPEILKLILFLRLGLLDERPSVWLLHYNTRLLFVDILSSVFELAVGLLKVSLGRLSDILNCSTQYIVSLLLMVIRSQVELSPPFNRLGWMVILLSIYEELSDILKRSDIILPPKGLQLHSV